VSRILAMETATRACSAALLWDGEVEEILRLEPNRHAETLLPMVQDLLASAQAGFHQLDALAVGSGPGSFTGLRIGISVAQGLALGAGLPVVSVSSLLALAARVDEPRVLAAIDARMNQVYWNVYRRDEDSGAMTALQVPRVNDPADVALPDEAEWHVAGSGCDAYRDRLLRGAAAPPVFLEGVHPHAGDIAHLAAVEYAAGRSVDARDAAPEYVRDEVAKRQPSP